MTYLGLFCLQEGRESTVVVFAHGEAAVDKTHELDGGVE